MYSIYIAFHSYSFIDQYDFPGGIRKCQAHTTSLQCLSRFCHILAFFICSIRIPIPIPSMYGIFTYIFPYKSTKCRQIFLSHGSSWDCPHHWPTGILRLQMPFPSDFQTSMPYSLRLALRASVLRQEDDRNVIPIPKWPWWYPTYGDEHEQFPHNGLRESGINFRLNSG